MKIILCAMACTMVLFACQTIPVSENPKALSEPAEETPQGYTCSFQIDISNQLIGKSADDMINLDTLKNNPDEEESNSISFSFYFHL